MIRNTDYPDNFTGTDVSVIRIMGAKYGFNINFNPSKGWSVRIQNSDGTFSNIGVVPEVGNGISTFGTGPNLLLYTNFLTIDYLFHAYLYIRYTSPKPLRLPPYLNITKPFTPTIWLSLVITLILATVIFILIIRFYDVKALKARDILSSVLIVYMCHFSQSKSCL